MTNLTLNLDTVAALRAVQALGQAASELKGLYEAIGEGVGYRVHGGLSRLAIGPYCPPC